MAELLAHDPLKAKARAYRRQFARRLGVRLDAFDAVTSEMVATYCRAKAAQALTDPVGDPERYHRAANVTGRALAALERRLRDVGLDGNGRDPAAALRQHVAENYPDSPGPRSGGRAPKVEATAEHGSDEPDVAGLQDVAEPSAAAGASS